MTFHPTYRRRDVLALAACLVAGCGRKAEPNPLRIAAASDLQRALPVVISAFRVERNIPIEPTFGASGQLAEQIGQGAPFDLFLSANQAYVKKLADAGVIRTESVQPYARGLLVLVVNVASGVAVRSLADLAKPEVKKIAIATPELAPYGLAAKQALERAKLWEALEPKIVRAESVRQSLQFVTTGNAEVGFVGRALADDPAVRVVPLALDAYDPIVQSLGIITRTSRDEDAEAFARFLVGEGGQKLLVDLGFGRAPEPPEADRDQPQ